VFGLKPGFEDHKKAKRSREYALTCR